MRVRTHRRYHGITHSYIGTTQAMRVMRSNLDFGRRNFTSNIYVDGRCELGHIFRFRHLNSAYC